MEITRTWATRLEILEQKLKSIGPLRGMDYFRFGTMARIGCPELLAKLLLFVFVDHLYVKDGMLQVIGILQPTNVIQTAHALFGRSYDGTLTWVCVAMDRAGYPQYRDNIAQAETTFCDVQRARAIHADRPVWPRNDLRHYMWLTHIFDCMKREMVSFQGLITPVAPPAPRRRVPCQDDEKSPPEAEALVSTS